MDQRYIPQAQSSVSSPGGSGSEDASAATRDYPIEMHQYTFSFDDEADLQAHADVEDDEIPRTPGPVDPVRVPIFTSKTSRNVTRANHEVLLEEVAHFLVGFDLKTFPEYIASWLPRLRNNPLPGSYEQLLLLMYDDLDRYVELQRSMTNGIPNFLETHLDQVKRADKLRNLGRSYEWSNPRFRNPATLRARSLPCQESKRRDEAFFLSELRMLRDLVTPVREPSRPIFWITCRDDRADEMEPEFAVSEDLIDDFKAHLVDSLYDHHKNYTIYTPLPPTSDQGKTLFSLKLHRLDACKGTLYWEKYPPDGIQLTEFYQLYREHIIETDPDTARRLNFLPPLNVALPTVNLSTEPGIELGTPWAAPTYESGVLTVLVRTAQWLALARGFPAVHLFYDLVRLFTIYGVDVANATQVEYCKLLINTRLPRDMPVTLPVIPFPFTDAMLHERNPEYYRDVEAMSHSLARALIHEDTLLSRDDDSISWDYPLQTLAWVVAQGTTKRVLGLKEPFRRCRFHPGHVVDSDWEDFVADHLEREDPYTLYGPALFKTAHDYDNSSVGAGESHRSERDSSAEDHPENTTNNAAILERTTEAPIPESLPSASAFSFSSSLRPESTFSQQELALWLDTHSSRPRMIPRSNSHRGPSQSRLYTH